MSWASQNWLWVKLNCCKGQGFVLNAHDYSIFSQSGDVKTFREFISDSIKRMVPSNFKCVWHVIKNADYKMMRLVRVILTTWKLRWKSYLTYHDLVLLLLVWLEMVCRAWDSLERPVLRQNVPPYPEARGRLQIQEFGSSLATKSFLTTQSQLGFQGQEIIQPVNG